MNREEFRRMTQERVLFLDGATGSNLQMKGMPAGVCPELWIEKHEDILIDLQREFIKNGTDIVYAPTFTGNRIKLEEYGIADRLVDLNVKLVGLSKKAIELEGKEGKVFIAGDITMTGRQLAPVGTMDFEELIDVYKEQVKVLAEAGVDLIVVETMMSLQECRAAVIAVKEVSDLPVMVTLTYAEDGRTLFGTDPETATVVLAAMGVDAVGLNCSTGPDKMGELVQKMLDVTDIPIIVKPNAGLPKMVNGETVYDMGPEEFAAETAKLVEMGAGICGGCCGTTPEHLKKLIDTVREKDIKVRDKVKNRKTLGATTVRAVTTEHRTVYINDNDPLMVIGERINPTGKKALQAELREGKLDMVLDFAEQQEKDGAALLDINVGMNGIDEKQMMLKVTESVLTVSDLPLCIDSSYTDIIEAALRRYPGRALINSISLEKGKAERLLPVAKKYGAMFILLPVGAEGLPKDLAEKKSIIDTIYNMALENSLTASDIVVDGLVGTIGANSRAALEVIETINYCQEKKLATMCGLSNISFGLPERQFINFTFLAIARAAGLNMAIANPSQDLLMNTAAAADLLLNKNEADIRYIERAQEHPLNSIAFGAAPHANAASGAKEASVSAEKSDADDNGSEVFKAVLKGNKRTICNLVQKEIDGGVSPQDILNKELIPAINDVGDKFNKKKYFLPQLIASAEAMKVGINYINPMLKQGENTEKKGVVVIATVEGDIHDIGKNLVSLMLENYGFEVHDLGKDVKCSDIIAAAKEFDADIIGLSALMTTTMQKMKDVVKARNDEKLKAKIMIGGAVITQNYCDEIGADGYSKDAQAAVTVAEELIKK